MRRYSDFFVEISKFEAQNITYAQKISNYFYGYSTHVCNCLNKIKVLLYHGTSFDLKFVSQNLTLCQTWFGWTFVCVCVCVCVFEWEFDQHKHSDT